MVECVKDNAYLAKNSQDGVKAVTSAVQRLCVLPPLRWACEYKKEGDGLSVRIENTQSTNNNKKKKISKNNSKETYFIEAVWEKKKTRLCLKFLTLFFKQEKKKNNARAFNYQKAQAREGRRERRAQVRSTSTQRSSALDKHREGKIIIIIIIKEKKGVDFETYEPKERPVL